MTSNAVIPNEITHDADARTTASVPLGALNDTSVVTPVSQTDEEAPIVADQRPPWIPRYTTWPEQTILRALALLLLVLDNGVTGTVYILSRKYGRSSVATLCLQCVGIAGLVFLCLVLLQMLCDFCNIRAFKRNLQKIGSGSERFVKSVSTPLDDDADYIDLIRIETFQRNFWRARQLDATWNVLVSLLYLFSGVVFALGGVYIIILKESLDKN